MSDQLTKNQAIWQAKLAKRRACQALDEAVLAAAFDWKAAAAAWAETAEERIWEQRPLWRLRVAVWPPGGASDLQRSPDEDADEWPRADGHSTGAGDYPRARGRPIITTYDVVGPLGAPGEPLQVWRDGRLETAVIYGERLEARRLTARDFDYTTSQRLPRFANDVASFCLPPGATVADLDPPPPAWPAFACERLGLTLAELESALSDLGHEALRRPCYATSPHRRRNQIKTRRE